MRTTPMNRKKSKRKKTLVIFLALILYFAALCLISNQRIKEKNNVELLADGNDFYVMNGDESYVSGGTLVMKGDTGDKTFALDVTLTGVNYFDISFDVDCPEDYKGAVIYVDLANWGNVEYDNQAQEFTVTLKAGENHVEDRLDPGDAAPDTAYLRIFTLDASDFTISNLTVTESGQSNGASGLKIAGLIIMAVLLFGVVPVFMWRKGRKTRQEKENLSGQEYLCTTESDRVSPIRTVLFILGLAVLALFTFFTIYGINVLFADGSAQVATTLSNGYLYSPTQYRVGAGFFNSWLMLLGMKAGVASISTLLTFCSLSTSISFIFFYGTPLVLSYVKRRNDFLCLTLLLLAFSMTNSGFFIRMGSNIASAWFWMSFVSIYLCSGKDRVLPWFILAATIPGIWINEFTLFYCPVLLLLIIIKFKKREITMNILWWYSSLVIAGGFLRGVWGTIIAPGISTSDLISTSLSKNNLFIWIQLIALALLLVFNVMCSQNKKVTRQKEKMLNNCNIAVQLIIIALFVLRVAINGVDFVAVNSSNGRIYSNLLAPIALACFCILLKSLSMRLDYKRLAVPAVAFVMAFVGFYGGVTINYHNYLDHIVQFCSTNEGLYYDYAVKEKEYYDMTYCWGWPAVTESLLAQAGAGKEEISCLVVNYNDWYWFNQNLENNYYKGFEKYGIHIDYRTLEDENTQ